jgi:hypothetical protein
MKIFLAFVHFRNQYTGGLMMQQIISNWINFLRQYGPIPRNDNMYDESIHRAIERKKIMPITIESSHINILIGNFTSDTPRSVVLTGTAGDGKTYHCREVWLQLKGSKEEWMNDSKIKNIMLPSGKLLHIIKDLSELQDYDSDRSILELFVESVTNDGSNHVFLVAANDGQLIDKWKHLEQTENVVKVRAEIEEMLVFDINESENVELNLYNLSQVSSAELFNKIANAVLSHPGWSECDNCAFKWGSSTQKRCPIWENKTRLEDPAGNQLLRKRVTHLLKLCEFNDLHLPIRQILLLVTNMFLGHPEVKDKLMTCKDIGKIIDTEITSQASIYRNIFGENLSKRKKDSTDIFIALNMFGIGYETSNSIDNILIFGNDDFELDYYFKELINSDTYYGADNQFRTFQKDYLEGNLAGETERFLEALRSQRQRLFFVVTDEQTDDLKLWNLTTFQYAGEYLEKVYESLEKNSKVSNKILARIAQGLNRIFTGLLAKNSEEIIIATSGSQSQARVSRIFEESISVSKKNEQSMRIIKNKHGKIELEVSLNNKHSVQLPLYLTRYEFISRVADGVLPGSFSRECYEDILGFKSKLLKKLQIIKSDQTGDEDETESEMIFRVIQLNKDGVVIPKKVEVMFYD